MLIIDGFRVDVETDGSHVFDVEITEHEVEEGAEISDHIDPRPIEVTVTGIVSGSPFGEIKDLRGDNPVKEAYDKLLEIRNNRQPVTITTSLGTFKNMALGPLNIPTNADIGDSFQFTATFKQITIVTNERTTIPVAVPQAARKKNRGKKQAKDAPLPEDQRGPSGTLQSATGITLADPELAKSTSLGAIEESYLDSVRRSLDRGTGNSFGPGSGATGSF